jgi:hypothetical protein
VSRVNFGSRVEGDIKLILCATADGRFEVLRSTVGRSYDRVLPGQYGKRRKLLFLAEPNMIRLKRCFIAVAFSLAGICAANGQSPWPKLQPEAARELFGVYAACNAYWQAMIQCVPSKLKPDDQARLRQTFEQLQAVSVEHMSSLAAKAQLSVGIQQQIKDKVTSRVYGGAVVSCNKVPPLVQEYRDKCAALFQNVAAAEKEALSTDQPTEAEIADSAAKFIISTCYGRSTTYPASVVTPER